MMNKKMAAILGADIPEDEEAPKQIVAVEPHEIVTSDNPDLPDMHDINMKQLQAEKQLEEVIAFTLGYQKSLFDEVSTVDPKYRSRYVEVANGTLNLALDAIKTKLKVQENQRKLRMDEAEFQRPDGGKGDGATQNFFFGSREDLMLMAQRAAEQPDDKES